MSRSRQQIAKIWEAIAALGGGSGGPVAWNDITGKPSTFPPEAHSHDGVYQPAGSYANATHGHAISDISGLQTALDGKQPVATVLTNTTASFTTAQETKLSGIATGATANSSDATLLNRANHTGSQPASTISDSTVAGRAMLTAADVAAQTALLDLFTTALKGMVPASGGGTANFLRADGTWAAPPGGGSVDQVAAPWLYDEFISGSSETGEVGRLGWSFTNGSMQNANAEANHPGIVTRRSGTTANQVASLYMGAATTRTDIQLQNLDETTFIVAPVASNTDHTVRVGLLADNAGNPPTNGAYFERLAADTNWFRVTRSGGVQTRTDTGVAYGTSWRKLRIRKNGANIEFYIDGTLNGTHTTNVPAGTTGLSFGVQVIPTTTTARDFKIDFFEYKGVAAR